MMISRDSGKKRVTSAFVIGFLFVVLGITAQAEAGWLLTVGGCLAILQGSFDLYRLKNQKSS